MKRALILAGLSTIALPLSPPALATSSAKPACGPRVSLLLWPKGHKAYPLPHVELFSGWSGPYGVPNLLAYAAAANDGTLGYPATDITAPCLNYGAAGKRNTPSLTGHATTTTRLACTFPEPVYVQIDNRPGYAKRLRVVAGSSVVADATVTTHGSRLNYAKRYCRPKVPLIQPTS